MENILTKEAILSFLRDQKDFLENEFGVTQIALFGSYARGEQVEESDIDLLIVMETANFDKRMDLKYFLQDHFNVPVDVGYLDSLRSHVREEIQDDIIYA